MKTRTGYACNTCERPLLKFRCEAETAGLHFCNNNCKKSYQFEKVVTFVERSVLNAYTQADWPPAK